MARGGGGGRGNGGNGGNGGGGERRGVSDGLGPRAHRSTIEGSECEPPVRKGRSDVVQMRSEPARTHTTARPHGSLEEKDARQPIGSAMHAPALMVWRGGDGGGGGGGGECGGGGG